jgi:NitT/TauT family transport system permease protein
LATTKKKVALASRPRRYWPSIAFAALLAGIWELVGRFAHEVYFPPISQVARATVSLWANGTLAGQLRISATALAGGLLAAIVIGVAVGALMGVAPPVRRALNIYVDAAMSAPMGAFVPVLIILFGLGYETRVVTIFLFAVFPIVVNTQTGIRTGDERLVEMARSFTANPVQLFCRVRLPMAADDIAAGLRIGVARGVDGMIVGEVLIATTGLGGLITTYGQGFQTDKFWAVFVTIALLALVSVAGVDTVADRFRGLRSTA